jgi:hypothetical protein
MRIGLGLMIVWFNLDLWEYLEVLIGPEALARPEPESWSWSRWTWFDHIEDLRTVKVIHALTLVVNVCFLIGFRSRMMGLLSVIALAALYQRNTMFTNGGDRLVREFTLYISLVPCGAALSVDSAIQRWRLRKSGLSDQYSSLVPIFAHRLIGIQLAVMYCLHADLARTALLRVWNVHDLGVGARLSAICALAPHPLGDACTGDRHPCRHPRHTDRWGLLHRQCVGLPGLSSTGLGRGTGGTLEATLTISNSFSH